MKLWKILLCSHFKNLKLSSSVCLKQVMQNKSCYWSSENFMSLMLTNNYTVEFEYFKSNISAICNIVNLITN